MTYLVIFTEAMVIVSATKCIAEGVFWQCYSLCGTTRAISAVAEPLVLEIL